MKSWLADLRRSFLAVAFLAVILCGLYPLASWVLAQGLFPPELHEIDLDVKCIL